MRFTSEDRNMAFSESISVAKCRSSSTWARLRSPFPVFEIMKKNIFERPSENNCRHLFGLLGNSVRQLRHNVFLSCFSPNMRVSNTVNHGIWWSMDWWKQFKTFSRHCLWKKWVWFWMSKLFRGSVSDTTPQCAKSSGPAKHDKIGRMLGLGRTFDLWPAGHLTNGNKARLIKAIPLIWNKHQLSTSGIWI